MYELSHRNFNGFNPFHEMEDIERRFFAPRFNEFFHSNELAEFKTDVTDEGEQYLLEADLPGFNKEDIRLELEGERLTITAERHSNVEKREKDQIVCVERSYGSYRRSFDLKGINPEGIKAKYENGVLQLKLPKLEENLTKARQIKIE